jgi:type 2A phosphatase activator TIP41
VLTLPEILFGKSSLQITHNASGVTLTFTAFEALQQWKADNLPPLKVAVAKEWQAARQQEIEKQQAMVLDYDWTYTTSYAGDLSTHAAASSGSHSSVLGSSDPSSTAAAAGANSTPAGPAAINGASSPASDQQQPTDGPSTTLNGSSGSGSSCQQHEQHEQEAGQLAWQPTSVQIDRQMLMSKNEPILFYAEVPLYESELDDNGVCQLTVKVSIHTWRVAACTRPNVLSCEGGTYAAYVILKDSIQLTAT